MVTHLFPRFLDDAEEYHNAEVFWDDAFRQIVDRYSKIRDWQPWLTTCFADGTPFADGNPIYSLISTSTGKGVRVIQLPPESSDVQITAFRKTFGGKRGESDTVEELVIHCELSEESAVIAKRLLIEWVKQDEIPENFEITIQQLLS
ncbi:MAG: hypothetical protein DWQ35_00515 [Planctomycetota bacterium]|nr:MAG: hypothetical protein DWQ35_00515 [Planctomycetota bacterium]REK29820.1 MAG: hypothetical protein DWQ42_02640 [Planctomycetota bacterium]REK48009.1 MAG: hypothetical protein DWQ46_03715 [Planctomycetota bacterium]